ncbi:MAG: hypothetical protein PVI44_13730, partial [Balneolaceae bacterium]
MNRKLIVFIIIGFQFLISCNHKNEYRKIVKRELAKGTRNDSLFLGYYFGMPRQEFFDYSWKLNSQKKVVQGSGSHSVRYDDVTGFDHPIHMNFYPQFYNDKIYKMESTYSYNGWAPWNRDLWSDSLEVKVLKKFQKIYKHKFIKMKHPELGIPAYIMVDKNKRIAIFTKGDE